MPSDDERFEFVDLSFPPGVEPLEGHVYRYKIGGSEVEDLGWRGYMKVAHEAGMVSRDVDVIDTGTTEGGVLYAAVKVTIEMEDGRRFAAVQGADETTNQVKAPEYVWAVAASRAFKRAVKNALNIYPVTGDADPEKHRVEDDRGRDRGSVNVDDEGNVSVDPPDGHEREGPSQGDGDFGFGG